MRKRQVKYPPNSVNGETPNTEPSLIQNQEVCNDFTEDSQMGMKIKSELTRIVIVRMQRKLLHPIVIDRVTNWTKTATLCLGLVR